MEQLTLHLPKMWADHHVLAVRGALAALGIQEVDASAARQSVRLTYDPTILTRDQILQALTTAGYGPTEIADWPEPQSHKEPGSAWFVATARVTQTNRVDLEMSGDFRKY
ncbi:MAG: heavy-metal-associated domain-containing protein [Anaerolineae bacterium]